MALRTGILIALLALSYTTEAGCPRFLTSFAKSFSWAYGKGVVAVHRHHHVLFLFGDHNTPDRVYLEGKKNVLLYEGRVLRIPVWKNDGLANGVIWPPEFLYPTVRVPRAVRDRVSSYYDLFSMDVDWEYKMVVTTEDGAIVITHIPGGWISREWGLHPWEKNKYTVVKLPSELKRLAKAELSSLGVYRSNQPWEEGFPFIPKPRYDTNYLMVHLSEDADSRNYMYADKLKDHLGSFEQREEPSEYLDFGAWNERRYVPRLPDNNYQRETWIVKAMHSDKNLAAENEDFVLYRFGVQSMKVDSEIGIFHRSIVRKNVLTLLPQEGNDKSCCIGPRRLLTEPVTIDLSELRD